MIEQLAEDSLAIIWTSRDPDVAKRMAFMYARNARLEEWWQTVRLIVWGPSAELLAKDTDLQDEMEGLKRAGVELWACKACADSYGVSAALAELGVKVLYTGTPLTDMLKGGWKILTV